MVNIKISNSINTEYNDHCALCILGWSSPAIVLLTSDESPLPSGKISMVEGSWIASLTNLGGLVGNICE